MRARYAAAFVAAVVAGSAGLAGCGAGSQRAAPTPTSPTPSATASQPPSASPAPTPTPTAPPTRTAAPSPPPGPAPTGSLAPALAGRDWERVPTSQRVVALTFDAGANGDGVPSILGTLAREHVPATFFLTGAFVRAYPDLADRIAATGNPVGNHSVDHPHFTQLSDAQVRAQVTGAAATIRAATGVDPRPLFRFPFGDRDEHAIALVNSLGYVPVRWTVDTLGWQGTSGGASVARVVDRVVASLQPGEIVLMHVGSHPTDGSTLDADALPTLVRTLRGKGYGFVTLRALTGG